MKLAVVSDIHGNLAALQAVTEDIAGWQPDAVVVAGDIVNRGPLPRQCLEFVLDQQRRSGWYVLRGNHEEYVLNIVADPSPRVGAEEAVRANVRWTATQIGDTAAIAAMPTIIQLEAPDGGEIRVVHASMRYNRDNILLDTPDDVLRAQIAPAPPLFCCGHTHRPLIRQIDTTLVVNAGAVGLPFDGDIRASYARLTWQAPGWHAEITRVPYNRDQAKSDYQVFLAESGPIAPIVFAEFQTALPRLSTWFRRYNDGLVAGTMTPAQAVDDFLRSIASRNQGSGFRV